MCRLKSTLTGNLKNCPHKSCFFHQKPVLLYHSYFTRTVSMITSLTYSSNIAKLRPVYGQAVVLCVTGEKPPIFIKSGNFFLSPFAWHNTGDFENAKNGRKNRKPFPDFLSWCAVLYVRRLFSSFYKYNFTEIYSSFVFSINRNRNQCKNHRYTSVPCINLSTIKENISSSNKC